MTTQHRPRVPVVGSAAAAEPVQAYVWMWRPGAAEPVVVGRLHRAGELISFSYGQSYLSRPDATPIFTPELPLMRGPIRPGAGLAVASCIRDAGPDAWGQRVILARHVGRLTAAADTGSLGLLTCLLESGSDRIGALDFQTSPTTYVPRAVGHATLEDLQSAAARLEAGQELSPALAEALLHGTSIGGARPKALLHDTTRGRFLIAKFAVASDPYPVVKAEAVAMELARRVGLNVAATELVHCAGKSVLLVDRFDRVTTDAGVERAMLVSALTLFGLDAMAGRYATYHGLADMIRARFTDPEQTLHELFGRIVFNICVSNTDDHARNHAAFYRYDAAGVDLTLTPGYDICPQLRSGDSAEQALAVDRDGRRTSNLGLCVAAAHLYQLTPAQAREIIDHQVGTIEEQWTEAADAATLTAVERGLLWRRQILNPAIHYDL